ncbi:MAG: cytochrome c-type biogenesis protein CcmH [Chloroflexi bacterium]|nr:cytochrome c-type biogenesis protein CcmH [Chloroflexota bacterium]
MPIQYITSSERAALCKTILSLWFIAIFSPSLVLWAQGDTATDNDVIRVSQRMYCPVCENIPLDECQTGACLEWKEEIRAQLTAGRSEQEIIDSFVARFGDHVVGVPQDPVLRALTVITPLLGTALAIGVGVHTFRLFGRRQKLSLPQEALFSEEIADDVYRQRLEDDVRAWR